ncbi:hypothetical protein AYO44_13130 [Planctomycetaceae bacterium SCGC AG-212-F19]|nr:hypothetical protein AYO44_13130 [Planctomycetaceae bacterium SCGC AG-212-F19]
MSAVRARTAQPKMFSTLADLSLVLDEAAEHGHSSGNPTAAFAEWGAAQGSPRGRYRRRRTLADYWPMGFAFAAGLWLLFAGVLMLAGRGRQSAAYAEAMPLNHEVAIIPDLLEDPVQIGRGGGVPNVLAPEEVPPAECLGTRVAFVDTLPEAIRQAKHQNKLLMVLNVSGDFEEARFT